MKKIFVVLGLFAILSSLCWAGGKKEQKAGNIQPRQVQQTIQPPSKPSYPYWNGEGGKGMRLGIRVPESQGLNANQAYLPTLVQGVLVSDISKYSAIDVVDRISLDKIIAETLDPTYKDDISIARLGHIEQPGYWMTGNIIRTSTGFTLQINVTDTTPNANTMASYNGVCMVVQLDDHSTIHKASLELLTQMGVQLTDKARNELEKASTLQYVNAQIALSRGIIAQQRGAVVEALAYYYEATAFDPSILEATNRASVMATAITSGNIGENVRNDIQRRNEWLKILREAATYFKAHLPYEIVYDPTLIEGRIDYVKETADIYMNLVLRSSDSGYKIIRDIQQGLKNTGRSADWGFSGWPNSGELAIFTDEILNFTITAVLINENGENIGQTSGKFKTGDLTFVNNWGFLIFQNINVNVISDNIRVSIINVNNINAKSIEERGYINILSEYIPLEKNIFLYKIENDTISITGYNGTYTNIIIPLSINNLPVKKIDISAFSNIERGGHGLGGKNIKNTQLNSVYIPYGVTSIDDWAFSENQITNIIIPDSVIYIGVYAFDKNLLTSVTIPRSITSIGDSVFSNNRLKNITIPNTIKSIGDFAFFGNELTSIVIPNSVTHIGYGAFSGNKITRITMPSNVQLGVGMGIFGVFETTSSTPSDSMVFNNFYDRNGKKAGTYTYLNGRWNYSP